MNCLYLKKRWLCYLFLFFIPLLSASPCFSEGDEDVFDIEDTIESKLEYLIGPEDVLDISVWKNAELSKIVTVRPDGRISLPLIGDVPAAGSSPDELRQAIVEKLTEYQETVVVSVIVQQVNSFKIFVLGEVANPGMYLLKNKTTLLQAIAMAGGFGQFASKNKIIVIREKSRANEEQVKVTIRFDDIIDKDKKSFNNLLLRPGDTIFVP